MVSRSKPRSRPTAAAERTEDAGPVPAAGTERGVIEADADPCRHLTSGGNGDKKIAAGTPVALGNRQRRRDHLGGDMGHGGAMGVAHRHRGDEIAVEQRGAGE
jgi:hypothetical protein